MGTDEATLLKFRKYFDKYIRETKAKASVYIVSSTSFEPIVDASSAVNRTVSLNILACFE